MISRIPTPILIFFDALSFFLALGFVLLIRYGTGIDPGVVREHILAFSAIFAVWLMVFGVAGLYGSYVFAVPKSWWQAFLMAFGVNAAIAIAAFYLLPFWSISPKTNLALILLISFTFVFCWRYILQKIWRTSFGKARAVLIGTKEECRTLLELLENSPRAVFLPVFVIVVDEVSEDEISSLNLVDFIKNEHAGVVLLGERTREYPDILDAVSGSLASGTVVMPMQEVVESLTQKVYVRGLNTDRVLEDFSGPHHRFADFLKRAFDITLALTSSAIGIFLLPFIALAIKFDDGGSVFYAQQRVGRGLRTFVLRKFRTMHAEPNNDEAETSWTQEFDSRITRIGKILRTTHLDEIPQLWNILRGDMSFVGPRPERVKLVKILEEEVPFYHLRHLVRPGLTGWAQINYHYASSVEESVAKLEYDLYYIKYRSTFLDLFILARTLKLIAGWGAR